MIRLNVSSKNGMESSTLETNIASWLILKCNIHPEKKCFRHCTHAKDGVTIDNKPLFYFCEIDIMSVIRVAKYPDKAIQSGFLNYKI